MDAEGQALPQVATAHCVPAAAFYETITRANFIIPSTVLMQRSVIVAAGLFDDTRPALHGCEDWDLWLRLATRHHFVATSACLARYRLHGSSLSAAPTQMQAAVRAVIEKHFGLAEGDPSQWSRIKQMAHGGGYAYEALTSVMRQGDWSACVRHLRRALHVDPALADEIGLFYDLAMGDQPLGYRGTPSGLDINANAERFTEMLAKVFDPASWGELDDLQHRTVGTAYLALGLLAYNTGHGAVCRRWLLRALRARPGLWRNPLVVGDLVKSLLAPRLLAGLRRGQRVLPGSRRSSSAAAGPEVKPLG
jgi:hypothetical protein